MFYFVFLVIAVVYIVLIKRIKLFVQYEKRLVEVSILLSINFLVGLLYNYLSTAEFFCISILLNLFNGPIFFYVLFDRSKYLFYLQYIVSLLSFIYIIGYSYYINEEIEQIKIFNYYSAIVSVILGIVYVLVCYYLLVQTSVRIRNESIIVVFLIVFFFESIMMLPDFKERGFDINPLFIYLGCTLILIISSCIYLVGKLLNVEAKNTNKLLSLQPSTIDLKISVVEVEYECVDIDEEKEGILETVEEEDVTEENKEDDFQYISLVLNEKLIENRLFLDPNLSLNRLSKVTNIPKTRLSSFFKSSEASNFNQYINRIRIEYAVITLHDYNHEELSIEKWALLSGFNSRVTFYRSFVNVYGFPPSELLKK